MCIKHWEKQAPLDPNCNMYLAPHHAKIYYKPCIVIPVTLVDVGPARCHRQDHIPCFLVDILHVGCHCRTFSYVPTWMEDYISLPFGWCLVGCGYHCGLMPCSWGCHCQDFQLYPRATWMVWGAYFGFLVDVLQEVNVRTFSYVPNLNDVGGKHFLVFFDVLQDVTARFPVMSLPTWVEDHIS